MTPTLSELTSREEAVLDLAGELSEEQIARRFGMTANTVRKHLASCRAKLDAPSTVAAVRKLERMRRARTA